MRFKPLCVTDMKNPTVENNQCKQEQMDTPKDNDPLVLHVRSVTGSRRSRKDNPQFAKISARIRLSVCLRLHASAGDKGFPLLQQRAVAANAELISVPDRGTMGLASVDSIDSTCRRRGVAIWHGHDYKAMRLD